MKRIVYGALIAGIFSQASTALAAAPVITGKCGIYRRAELKKVIKIRAIDPNTSYGMIGYGQTSDRQSIELRGGPTREFSVLMTLTTAGATSNTVFPMGRDGKVTVRGSVVQTPAGHPEGTEELSCDLVVQHPGGWNAF
jgi:hypothetical protein